MLAYIAKSSRHMLPWRAGLSCFWKLLFVQKVVSLALDPLELELFLAVHKDSLPAPVSKCSDIEISRSHLLIAPNVCTCIFSCRSCL